MRFPQENEIVRVVLTNGITEVGEVLYWGDKWIELRLKNNNTVCMREKFIMAYRILKNHPEDQINETIRAVDPNEVLPINEQFNYPPIEDFIKPKAVKALQLKSENLIKKEAANLSHDIKKHVLKLSDQHLNRISSEKNIVREHMKRHDLGGIKQVQYDMPSFKKHS